MLDSKGLWRFGGMILVFCIIMAAVMSWVRKETRRVPVENQLMLTNISSSIDSVAVILRENNQMIIQIRMTLDGLPISNTP